MFLRMFSCGMFSCGMFSRGMLKDAAKMLLKTEARLLDCAERVRIHGLKKDFYFLLHPLRR
jgi:hypothetical protein